MTLGVAQRFVKNESDGWSFTRTEIGLYLERALSESPKVTGEQSHDSLQRAEETIGSYLHRLGLLGQRTAEMHAALARISTDPAFDPEPFTPHYQRGLYQSMRSLTSRSFDLLRKQLKSCNDEVRREAEQVLDRREEIFRQFEDALKADTVGGKRIRTHGDYHLGQVLFTGRDWVIIDFEGEPARSLGERRIKRSPLRDVAGMLRSFSYASHDALLHEIATGTAAPDSPLYAQLKEAIDYWQGWVSHVFLASYQATAEPHRFLPEGEEQRKRLLEVYLMEKAVYELNYELNNRPHLVRIPVDGILGLLDRRARA